MNTSTNRQKARKELNQAEVKELARQWSEKYASELDLEAVDPNSVIEVLTLAMHMHVGWFLFRHTVK